MIKDVLLKQIDCAWENKIPTKVAFVISVTSMTALVSTTGNALFVVLGVILSFLAGIMIVAKTSFLERTLAKIKVLNLLIAAMLAVFYLMHFVSKFGRHFHKFAERITAYLPVPDTFLKQQAVIGGAASWVFVGFCAVRFS